MSRWVRRFAGSFKRYLVVATVAFGTCAGNAYAATFTFDNATLNLDELAWTFSLSTADWPASFGSGAFIAELETVNWQASGLVGEVTNVALHLQGLDTANFPEGSMWLMTGGTPTR